MKTSHVAPVVALWFALTPCAMTACGPFETSAVWAGLGASAVGGGITMVTEGQASEGTTAIVVGGVLILVGVGGILLMGDSAHSSLEHLDRHRREVRLALARGDGRFIDDVTAELGAPRHLSTRVGAVLQPHHESLSAHIAESPVTIEAAARFGADVLNALRAEPDLAPWVDAFLDGLKHDWESFRGPAARGA